MNSKNMKRAQPNSTAASAGNKRVRNNNNQIFEGDRVPPPLTEDNTPPTEEELRQEREFLRTGRVSSTLGAETVNTLRDLNLLTNNTPSNDREKLLSELFDDMSNCVKRRRIARTKLAGIQDDEMTDITLKHIELLTKELDDIEKEISSLNQTITTVNQIRTTDARTNRGGRRNANNHKRQHQHPDAPPPFNLFGPPRNGGIHIIDNRNHRFPPEPSNRPFMHDFFVNNEDPLEEVPGRHPVFIEMQVPRHGNPSHGLLSFLATMQGGQQEQERPSLVESKLPDKIESEPDATQGENVCMLCEQRSVKTALAPCGHQYMCVTCCHSPSMKDTCAICRKQITSIIRIFPASTSVKQLEQ